MLITYITLRPDDDVGHNNEAQSSDQSDSENLGNAIDDENPTNDEHRNNSEDDDTDDNSLADVIINDEYTLSEDESDDDSEDNREDETNVHKNVRRRNRNHNSEYINNGNVDGEDKDKVYEDSEDVDSTSDVTDEHDYLSESTEDNSTETEDNENDDNLAGTYESVWDTIDNTESIEPSYN